MLSPSLIAGAAPGLFVFLWATGFIVARLVAPHAEPLTFLVVRYAGTILVLGALSVLVGARWPRRGRDWLNAIVAGILLQGIYLAGVFWSVRHGLPAGIAALIACLQPLLTGMLAGPVLGERVSLRRWIGLLAGIAGVLLVLAPRLSAGSAGAALSYEMVVPCFIAMVSVTLGTLWQKKTAANVDLRTNATIQFIAALVLTLPAALLLEDMRFDATRDAWIGLGWSVLATSTGGILLLLWLIRQGAVAGVSALFYLVPPVSALMAYILFGEQLTLVQIAGMAVTAAGVAIASRG